MAFSLKLVVGLFGLVACVSAIPSGRVVGGADASVGQFPHQVSLQSQGGSHACGGSILNKNYILTAARCVAVGFGLEPFPPQFFQVRVGSVQRNAGGKLVQLKRIIVNENYLGVSSDVALLELQEPLVWTDNIQPIEMADMEVPSGEDVIISGWGQLYSDGPIPHRMQWNTLKAMTTAECQTAIGLGNDNLICLAHEQGNGACDADLGGPATYQGKLVGVGTFIYRRCGTKNPDGYAKVFYHRDWIRENMTP